MHRTKVDCCDRKAKAVHVAPVMEECIYAE